ncbi:porin [Burkholderia sp. Ac-20379]|uniref:porin n=1 Tax=Burkholderia sp. Ac-20379 TaxID=2703900 RepID=UPI00197CEAD8|nr:porin [Burkholderia sp. Ac-20379]MBN3727487.1 porin [Burkholderia sp. Ac-20379]
MSTRLALGRTLFATAAALAAGPVLAQSSVTLYGVADNALTYVNNQNGHSNVYLRDGNLYASKFGLRGNEDLGGGTKAIFDLQAGFNLNTGAQASAGTLFNRQAFVGLQNDRYGTLTAGRQYTPYYLFVGAYDSSNWLTGATGAHPGDIDGLDTTVRINNSVTYTSPTVGGFTASAMMGLSGIPGSAGKGDTISAALRYANGPLGMAVGYLRMNSSGQPAGFSNPSIAPSASFATSVLNQGYLTARAVQHVAASGNYKFGNLLLGLNYSNVKYLPGAQSAFTDTAIFNTYGAIAVYRFTPVFSVGGGYSYTTASKANGISNAARYHQVSLKEAYNLSQRTILYAVQAYQHAGGNTLGAKGAGDIVAAAPAVGDSQQFTASSTKSQFVGMVGIAVMF